MHYLLNSIVPNSPKCFLTTSSVLDPLVILRPPMYSAKKINYYFMNERNNNKFDKIYGELRLVLTPRVSFKTAHTAHVIAISAMSFTSKYVIGQSYALFIVFIGQAVEKCAISALELVQ